MSLASNPGGVALMAAMGMGMGMGMGYVVFF